MACSQRFIQLHGNEPSAIYPSLRMIAIAVS